MQGDRQHTNDGLGVAIAGALGLVAGLVFGLVSGELLGNVDSDRVRRAVNRWRPGDDDEQPDEELDKIEHDLLATLKSNPVTRGLSLEVRALGGGLVELTGTVPNESSRELAGELARAVPGADLVVNRVLVAGTDTNEAVGS